MPVEETENEIRVRVRMPGEFVDGSIRQLFPTSDEKPKLERAGHWPYNDQGIRGLGGRLKDGGDWELQALRFSKDGKYDWTPGKAETWAKDHGYSPKFVCLDNDELDFEFSFAVKAIKKADQVPKADRVEVPDGVEVVYIEGPASTNAVDRQGDVIEQASIEFGDFMANPILLFQHNPDWPIGRVVRLEKDMDLGDGLKGLFCRAAIIGNTPKAQEIVGLVRDGIVRAFSVHGKVKSKKRRCSGGECFNLLVGLYLLEISAVSIPANQKTLFEVVKGLVDAANKATFVCECMDCGHTIQADQHCRSIPCPKCGGEMRRTERPGPGARTSLNDGHDGQGAGSVPVVNDEKPEEKTMSETNEPGTPEPEQAPEPEPEQDDQEKQELPPDLPQRLEAVEAWGPIIEDLVSRVEALEAMSEEGEAPAEGEEAEAAADPADGKQKAEDEQGDTEQVIEARVADGTKKSFVLREKNTTRKSAKAGPQSDEDIVVQKQMAEKLWKRQHPK